MSNLRQARINDSRTPMNTMSIAVRATTFAEFCNELGGDPHYKSYTGMKATVMGSGQTEASEVSGSDTLPAGDFRIFFTPEKQKSGN